MESERIRNSSRNIRWGLINQALMILGPFVTRTVILYTLGTAYLGLNSLFTSILQVLNMAELGFASAIVYNMYKPIALGNTELVCALMKLYKKVYRLIGISILIIGAVLIPFLSYLIKGSYPSDINLTYLYLVYLLDVASSYFLFAYQNCLLVAHQRNDIVSKIAVMMHIIMYAGQCILLILTKDYMYYALLMPVYTISNNIYCAYISRKYYPQYICSGEVGEEIKNDIKKQVSGLLITKIAATTRNSFDSIIMSAFIGISIVGVYGNYSLIMSAVISLLIVILRGIQASVGNSVAIESKEKNYSDFLNLVFIYAWLSGFCTTVMFCLYQPFIKLWAGIDNLLSLDIVILQCLYFYFLTAGDVTSVYIDATGIWSKYKLKAVLESISNLVLNLMLVQKFGIFGIVFSTVITRLLFGFFWGEYLMFKSYFGIQFLNKFYYSYTQYFLITIIASALSWACCEYLILPVFIDFIFRILICCIIFNVLFYIAFNKRKELYDIKNIIRYRFFTKNFISGDDER